MSVTPKTRRILRDRSDGVCEVCGLERATNLHHRKNRSQGRDDSPANLLHVCGTGNTKCHGWITEHPTEAYGNGWSVRSFENPTEIPVLYRGVSVYLDALGNVNDDIQKGA